MKTTTTLTLQAQRLVIISLTTMLYVMSSVGEVKAQIYTICASHTGTGNQNLTELNNIFLCNSADTIKLNISGADINADSMTIGLDLTYFSLIGSSLINCTLSSTTNQITITPQSIGTCSASLFFLLSNCTLLNSTSITNISLSVSASNNAQVTNCNNALITSISVGFNKPGLQFVKFSNAPLSSFEDAHFLKFDTLYRYYALRISSGGINSLKMLVKAEEEIDILSINISNNINLFNNTNYLTNAILSTNSDTLILNSNDINTIFNKPSLTVGDTIFIRERFAMRMNCSAVSAVNAKSNYTVYYQCPNTAGVYQNCSAAFTSELNVIQPKYLPSLVISNINLSDSLLVCGSNSAKYTINILPTLDINLDTVDNPQALTMRIDNITLPINLIYFEFDSITQDNNLNAISYNLSFNTDSSRAVISINSSQLVNPMKPHGMDTTFSSFYHSNLWQYLSYDDTLQLHIHGLRFKCAQKLQTCNTYTHQLNLTTVLSNSNNQIRFQRMCQLGTTDIVTASDNNFASKWKAENNTTANVLSSSTYTDIGPGTPAGNSVHFQFTQSGGAQPWKIKDVFNNNLIQCTTSYYYAYLKKKPYYTISDVTVTLNGATEVLPLGHIQSLSDTALLINYYLLIGYNTHGVQIKFKATIDCGEATALTGIAWGLDFFNLEFRNTCDTTCVNCYRNLGCSTLSLYRHCPGQCESAISIDSVIIQRANYGWVNYLDYQANSNTPNLSSADLSDESLRRVYPCDTVSIYAQGIVYNIPDNALLQFELLYQPPIDTNHAILTFEEGVFNLIDSLGNTIYTATASNPVTFVNPDTTDFPNSILYRVSVPDTDINFYQLVNDTFSYNITFTGKYSITGFGVDELPVGVYPIPQIRAQFIAGNDSTPNMAAQSCDPYGDDLIFIKIKTDVQGGYVMTGTAQNIGFNNIMNVSECNIRYVIRAHTYGGYAGDDFPEEYRPVFFWGDTAHFSFQLSANYTFDQLRQSIQSTPNTALGWTTNPATIQYDANGFGISYTAIPTDKDTDNLYNTLEFRLNQVCSNLADTLYLDTLNLRTFCGVPSIQEVYPITQYNYNGQPNLVLSTQTTLDTIPVSSNSSSIPMMYYHKDFGNKIYNAWVSFLSASEVSAQGTGLDSIGNGIYSVDTLYNTPANAVLFNLNVALNCLNDSLPYDPIPIYMYYGYNCAVAPQSGFTIDSLLNYSCNYYIDTLWIQPLSPNLNLNISADTVQTDSCIYVYYIVEFDAQSLNNSQAQNTWLYLTPIPGFSYVPSASYVTFNSGSDYQYYYNGTQAPGLPMTYTNILNMGYTAAWNLDSVLLDDVFSADSIQHILYHFAFIPSCNTPAGIYDMSGLLSAANACNDTIYSQVANGNWNFTPSDSVCCNNSFKLEVSVTPACDSTCNGTATFEWSGGIPPYNISFNGTDYTNVGSTMSSVLDSLCGGDTVCIYIMDANFASIFTCVPIPVSVPVVYITLPQYKPCKGDTIMLAGAETVNYIWKTGLDTIANTDTIYVSPQVPTWYYLTGIDSFGCVNYDTALVDVDTFMIYVNITDTNFCDNDSGFIKLEVQTNMNDSVTYQWEPASGLNTTTGAVVYASPTVTTTYTVYGHHNTCTVRDTIVVRVDCCVPIQPKRVKTTGENSSQNQWLSSGNLSHSRLDIQGHLTINTNLTLQYDTISIYSNKQIIVQSGYTLTIKNSILYACKDMWSGIRLEPGAQLIINNSLILDADTAILSRSNADNTDAYGYYQLNYVTFNKNRYGIVQMPHPDISNTHINIRGCTFDCQSNIQWSAGDNLKAPYSSQKSHTAIVMDMSIDEPVLTIGDASSGAYRNYIYRHQYGLIDKGGSLRIENLMVQYLYSTAGCTAIDGAGVWQHGGNLTMEASANLTNIFDHCRVGVLYESGVSQTVRINGNQFSNIGLGLECLLGQVKAVGVVWVRQSKGMQIDVNDNEVLYSERGIRVVLCSECEITAKYNSMRNNSFNINITETHKSTITVYENRINEDMNNSTWSMEGVNISQVLSTPLSASVSSNTIKKSRVGVKGSYCNFLSIRDNTIEFPSNTNGAVKYSIRIEGCEKALVTGNIIVRYGGAAQSGQQNQLFGISSELSVAAHIRNNIIARCGTAIRILGDNSGGLNVESFIYCNRMIDYYYGLRLDAAGIGTQGSEDEPSDNRWEISSGNTTIGIYDYYTIGNASSEWWVRDDAGRPWWLQIANPLFPQYFIVNNPYTEFVCTYDSTSQYRREEYGDIIRNMGRYSLDSINAANDYMFKWQVFNYIVYDSSYFSLGDSLDAHFISFADTFKYTVAGIIGNINEYLRRGDTLQAQQYLSMLMPGDSAEYVYKQVLRIYERTWVRGIEHIDSAFIYDLHKIALRHPQISGMGVYMARAMAQEDYDDFLTEPESSRRSEAEKDSTAMERFILYPNPSDGFVRYEWGLEEETVKEMVISDMQGRQLIHQSLPQKQGMVLVNLVDYPSGIYLLQLFCNGSRCNTQRIIKQ